ncbi:hypothetical protein ACFB49_32320 [Sphingomonas sp. DBB INV C78]
MALTEFALFMIPTLFLGLAGLETVNFVIANVRIGQIAMATADNAARVRDTIDEHDINEMFIGAKLAGQGIHFADQGRIILSSIEPRTVAPLTTTVGGKEVPNQWIRWQRCYGMKNVASAYGAPRTAADAVITDGSEAWKRSDPAQASAAPSDQVKSVPMMGATASPTGIGPNANRIAALTGTAVLFVEVVYDYKPIFWSSLIGERTIRDTIAFNVRQRADQVLRPGGLAATSWSTCSRRYV